MAGRRGGRCRHGRPARTPGAPEWATATLSRGRCRASLPPGWPRSPPRSTLRGDRPPHTGALVTELAAFALGLALVGLVFWDLFQTIVVPRPTPGIFRIGRYIVRGSWRVFRS